MTMEEVPKKEVSGGASEKPASESCPASSEPAKPPADPVQQELAALREKAAKAEEYLDLAKRTRADFLNYQDRIRRERSEWTRQAVADFLKDLLPSLDSFTLARFEDPRFSEAIRLIEREILRVLAKWNVVPIEAQGRKFDPLYHEAVAVQESMEQADGTVLEEVRRGWLIEGRVLRPASVRVARRPAAPPSPPAQDGNPAAPPA